MAKEKEIYDHPLYKHCEEKDADAIAWAFINSKKWFVSHLNSLH